MSKAIQIGSVSFRRSLELGRASVRIDCAPGVITVLQDENGQDLPAYESFFLNQKSNERISIERDGRPLELHEVLRVGFSPFAPAESQINQYLSRVGYSESEISKILPDYELDKVHYLPCAHLPQVAQRIVELLGTIRSHEGIVILRDPFMPLSGRWREHFAQLLLNVVTQSNQIVICTQLSFLPQRWSVEGVIQYLDVGHAAEEARTRYRWEQEQRLREQEMQRKKRAEVQEAPALTSEQSPSPALKPSTGDEPPEDFSAGSRYRGVYDWIFRPLSEISDFLRTYHLAVGLGGVACILITMGVTLGPNIRENWEKVAKLSAQSELTVGTFFKLMTQRDSIEDSQEAENGELSQTGQQSDLTPLSDQEHHELRYVLDSGLGMDVSECHDAIAEQLRIEAEAIELEILDELNVSNSEPQS